MRESIGATGIFIIVVTFIILFTAYLSVSVNYAKAFKIKNHIISIIEENNVYNDSVEDQIKNYLIAQRYSAHGVIDEVPDGWNKVGCVGQNPTNDRDCMTTIFQVNRAYHNNYDPICNGTKTYYKVVTYFNFVLPILNINIPFKVSGDTGTICEDV